MIQSFQFIFKAVKNKRRELFVSLMLVLVLLLLSSTLMYFLERNAQPEAFKSISATMWWSVATLTTVGYGDVYPITAMGKLIGGVIAVLGLGLFALPTGIIASGFVEAMDDDKKQEQLKLQEEQLKAALKMDYYMPLIEKKLALNMAHIPRHWLSMDDAKYKLGFSEQTVFDIVHFSNNFRLRNVKINKVTRAGIELFETNRNYGLCLDNASSTTVINMYAAFQPFFGHFSKTLADQLQGNYLSNELYNTVAFDKEKRVDLLENDAYLEANTNPILETVKQDITHLLDKNHTCILLIPESDDKETLFQFCTGKAANGSSFFKNDDYI